MEFFAKNAGIRRATGDWILTTNSDVFLGREIVARLAAARWCRARSIAPRGSISIDRCRATA